MITNTMISHSHSIAKGLAPYDTGNLRENAIKIRDRRFDRFTILYSASDAYYIKYVEEGTKQRKGQRFIERTFHILSNYITNMVNGERVRDKKQIDNAFKEASDIGLRVDTPERRLTHATSMLNYYQSIKEWVKWFTTKKP